MLKARAENGVIDLIRLCGADPLSEGMTQTPKRFVKAFLEYTKGYQEDPKDYLKVTFPADSKELVMVTDIEFFSQCEHHLAPFFGKAHVGYIPTTRVTGLSKIARMVEGYARRFQVQERLTTQIADAMQEVLRPQGVMVVVEARHMCMCSRGVNKPSAVTKTSAVRGVFSEQPPARAEFLSILNGR